MSKHVSKMPMRLTTGKRAHQMELLVCGHAEALKTLESLELPASVVLLAAHYEQMSAAPYDMQNLADMRQQSLAKIARISQQLHQLLLKYDVVFGWMDTRGLVASTVSLDQVGLGVIRCERKLLHEVDRVPGPPIMDVLPATYNSCIDWVREAHFVHVRPGAPGYAVAQGQPFRRDTALRATYYKRFLDARLVRRVLFPPDNMDATKVCYVEHNIHNQKLTLDQRAPKHGMDRPLKRSRPALTSSHPAGDPPADNDDSPAPPADKGDSPADKGGLPPLPANKGDSPADKGDPPADKGGLPPLPANKGDSPANKGDVPAASVDCSPSTTPVRAGDQPASAEVSDSQPPDSSPVDKVALPPHVKAALVATTDLIGQILADAAIDAAKLDGIHAVAHSLQFLSMVATATRKHVLAGRKRAQPHVAWERRK